LTYSLLKQAIVNGFDWFLAYAFKNKIFPSKIVRSEDLFKATISNLEEGIQMNFNVNILLCLGCTDRHPRLIEQLLSVFNAIIDSPHG